MKELGALLYGVGLGPGDPQLITLAALDVLKNSDLIVIPRSKRPSALEAILNAHNLSAERLELPFAMSREQADLRLHHEDAYAQIKAHLEQKKIVAFVTLGDPSLYSTFSPMQKRALADGFEVRVIPGIIAPCAAAATANTPLVIGAERLTIIPSHEAVSLTDDALVLMKIKFHFDEVKEKLEKVGRLSGSYLATRIGMDGEELLTDLTEAPRPRSYFSTMYVPPKSRGKESL